jgi:hypothetical protein
MLPFKLLVHRFGMIHGYFVVAIVVFGVQKEELCTLGSIAIFYMGK